MPAVEWRMIYPWLVTVVRPLTSLPEASLPANLYCFLPMISFVEDTTHDKFWEGIIAIRWPAVCRNLQTGRPVSVR